MRALLDVNVLLALFDPDHPHHTAADLWRTAAHAEGWASCPLTQNGFVRVISAPSYRRPLPIVEAIHLLRRQLLKPGHVFWPDDISLSDPALFDQGQLVGSNQITDAYLLELAVKNGGRLATFDRGIPVAAVRGAEPRHMVLL
ncbi:MAG: PIN domain-containing protein [Pseudolabrys sp.]|nr:PIN domain-containing protein [Pseudolabrys sp.]